MLRIAEMMYYSQTTSTLPESALCPEMLPDQAFSRFEAWAPTRARDLARRRGASGARRRNEARSVAQKALLRTTSTHGTGPSRQRPTFANPEGGGLVHDDPAAQDAGPLPGGREQGWCTRASGHQALARGISTHGTGLSWQHPTLADPEGGGAVHDGLAAGWMGVSVVLARSREVEATRGAAATLAGRPGLSCWWQEGGGSGGCVSSRVVGVADVGAAGIAELLCGDRARCLLGRWHVDCLPVCSLLCVVANRRGMSMVSRRVGA
eukprot:COSAG02_NODE_3198_length_7186_cov_9.288557_1_plen_265_part_00